MRILRRLFPNRGQKESAAGVYGLISAIDQKVRGRESIQDLAACLDAARVPLFALFCRPLGSSLAAKALTLKILNVLLAKYHLLTRSTVLLSRPYGLQVDPSNACNLACPGCVHSPSVKALKIFDWNKGTLSEERFRGLLRLYGSYLFQIVFCNYGEPITNPNTPKLIEIAKSYLTQTVLSTNLAIGRFDAEAYVRSGLDFLLLSIDGATQKVYERYRKNGNIEIVYRNIQNLVKARRALRKRTPVIRWQYLAFEHNAHEIPLALEVARALGVDEFNVETPFDVSWDDPGIRPAGIPAWSRELDSGTEEKFSENSNLVPNQMTEEIIEREFAASWSAKLREQQHPAHPNALPAEHTCHWLYKSMVMDANGRILPCCAAPGPGLDLVFSTLVPDQVGDCFNSERYQTARLLFADRAAYESDRASGPASPNLYCENCKWDQVATNIGPDQVAQALKTFGKGVIDSRSIEILSAW